MGNEKDIEAKRAEAVEALHGDAATAELFGVGRFMSCDSVRRNFASIPTSIRR